MKVWRLATLFFVPLLIGNCTLWPGITAVAGLLGGKSQGSFFFIPPATSSSSDAPVAHLDPGNGSGSEQPENQNQPENPPQTEDPTGNGTLNEDPGQNPEPVVSLKEIRVDTSRFHFALGTNIEIRLTGIYSNNTNQNITQLAEWEVLDSQVMQIQGIIPAPQIANGNHKIRFHSLKVGSTEVRARFQGRTISQTFHVTPAELLRVEMDPREITVIRGMSVPFHVTGYYTNGTTADLTDHGSTRFTVTPTLAEPNQPAPRRIRGTNAGFGSVTVVHNTDNGVFSDTANITVKSPALISIAIHPSEPQTAPLGLTRQFQAMGNYENGESRDLTGDVTWHSNLADVANFLNPMGEPGVLQTLSVGTAQIHASLEAIQSPIVSLAVIQKQLTGISIGTPNLSSPKGIPIFYQAIGTFTDGTTEDITQAVTWSVLEPNPAQATIQNSGAQSGRAVGWALGTSVITAAHGSFSAQTGFTATPAILQSLSLVPGSSDTVAGEFRSFSAIGTLSSGRTADYTQWVTWSTDNASIAGISNAETTKGRMQALAQGNVVISASYTEGSHPTVTGTTTARVLAADTTPPTLVSANSTSPTTVEIRFDKPMNSIQATTPTNFKVVLTSSLTGLNCATNANFTNPGSAIAIQSIVGSGTTYTITLNHSQSFGVNYSVVVDRTKLYDLAATPNSFGCPNSASFEGQARLRVSSAVCQSLNRVVVNFSKPVLGGSVPGSAECDSIATCHRRYRLDSVLGDITSAKILDGSVCGGLPANPSQICVTHSLLQSGANYNLIAANGIDHDGFDDGIFGAIRDFQNSEDLQANPRDRAGFSGCGVVPNNFADGPISENTFGDGTSFGYLTNYNSRIYVGPNAQGNSAARFHFDGSSPQNIGFLFEKHTSHANTAPNRDGGISVPPFVTMGHTGCGLNTAHLTTGCGPDNENGRGSFAKVSLFSEDFLIMGGSRNPNPLSKWKDYNYIYLSNDAGSTLNFKWIRLGSITGASTEGVQSFASQNNRIYMGFAKLNEPNFCAGMPAGSCSGDSDLSRNAPDFGVIRFRQGANDSNACGTNQNCDAGQNNRGTRFRIDALDYFGGTNANSAKTATDNWGRYVGVDSLFVFRNRIYAANGGHHKVNHNGSIIRSDVQDPGACNIANNHCDGSFVEIGPRSHPFWHGSGIHTNRWFSLELRKAADFSPSDHAFAQFAEFKGNLFVTRTICQTDESTAETHTATFFLDSVPGCTDGNFQNRRPQLWKCVPETTGDPNTCDSGDWSVVADGGQGISNLGYPGNHSATMLVANGDYLYYGMDNHNGVQVWRTNSANPSSLTSEWERVNGDGFGDPNMRNIFSAISVPVGDQKFVYISVGKNGTPLKIYRQQNN